MDQIEDLPGLLTSLAFPTGDQKAYAQHDATLQSCLKLPGFLNQLQAIVAVRDGSVPREVRLLASLIVAREVPKKWRARAIITDDIKPEMRRRFFEFFDEDDYQIARSQLRLLVTVARADYPRHWPSLLQDLLGPLQESAAYLLSPTGGSLSNNGSGTVSASTSASVSASGTPNPSERQRHKTRLLNALWTWNAFVKEWRSVKIPAGANLMKDLLTNLRPTMLGYLEMLMARDPSLEDWELLECARYAFKTCARLLEWEFSRPKTQQVQGSDPATSHALIHRSLQYLAKLQGFRLQLLDSPLFTPNGSSQPPVVPDNALKLLRSLTKYIRAIGKTYEALMHIDPKTFAAIDGTIQAIGWWWSEVSTAVKAGQRPKDDDVTNRYPKRFMLLGLILFKNVLPILSTEHKHSELGLERGFRFFPLSRQPTYDSLTTLTHLIFSSAKQSSPMLSSATPSSLSSTICCP